MRRVRIVAASCVLVISLVLFGYLFVHAVGVPSVLSVWPDTGQSAVGLHAATSSLPVRLQIPSLHIDAKVQYVGTTPAGTMGVPSNFVDVAWFKQGTVPGQLGSAAIDGHVDNGLALAGVFKHLGDIAVGDSVYVQTKDKGLLHFVVYDIESYPYTEVPLQTIFGRTDGAYLNLITCEGAWVQGQRTYDHRLVVYTKLAQ
jgi:sortase A